MRKTWWLILLMIAGLQFIGSQLWASQEFVIGPYPVRETAVKGEIISQLERIILALGQVRLEPGEKLKIKITGSSDQTGLEAKNDAYSRDRAQGVEGYLKSRLTDADFASIPRGSELNAREVRISWDLVPALPENTANKKLMYLSVWALLFALTIMLILGKKMLKREVVTVQKRLGSPVQVKHMGTWYDFIPELNEDSVPLSLHFVMKDNKPFYLPYKKASDLADSISKTLKSRPEVIKQLILEGRWKPLDHQPEKGVRS